ncbi:MAG: MBOAT family protein [Reyranella sp.]|nr:MBOAT family protein [Reyranella sp.]
MVFSSQLFLYGFLPVFFALYFLIDDRRKNWLILAASLIFYAVGAGSTVIVLLASIWLNQFLAVRIAPASQPWRVRLLALGITVNLLGLGYYKYVSFLWQLLGDSFVSFALPPLPPAPEIPLPVGISFFTFQAISYLIDVYRREIPPASGYGEFAVYHSLFPQLVAGPIVRYSEIRLEMDARKVDRAALSEGGYRFCLGLGKKMVVADNLGIVVDSIFALPPSELAWEHAWVGILCYSLQIYFDFSGYSDMAIGLGRVMGFHFPENFDQPYRSATITEFWRRWHMTLSRWFRDYLYIPLGGNRHGTLRTFINLWIVFFLCGLWHGAGLTFIVWGLYHGSLLVAERYAHRRWRPAGLPAIGATFVLVSIGWVFFRAPTLAVAWDYLAAMFLVGPAISDYRPLAAYLHRDTLAYLALGVFFAFTPLERFYKLRFDRSATLTAQIGLATLCLIYSMLLLAANSFNPFIYFRF